MSLNFALAQQKRKTKASQPVKINAKARTRDMHVILHINDTLNDS